MAQPSSSRGGAAVRLLALHTAEGARRVTDLDAYFARTREGSSHAGADNNALAEGGSWVPYDRAAWTLRSGNAISDNLELCGFASWSRETWLIAGAGMLKHAAEWLAARSKARGIPLRLLSEADVRRGRSGVIGHVTWTRAMNDGTHWDPGPGFPYDVVLAAARQIADGGAGQMPAPEKVLTEVEMFLVFDARYGVFWAVRSDLSGKAMIHPDSLPTVNAGWAAAGVKSYGPCAFNNDMLDRIPTAGGATPITVEGVVPVDLVGDGQGAA